MSFDREPFLRSILDSVPGVIAYWDNRLICRFANHAYLEWFGKTSEQMTGVTIDDFLGERLYRLNEPHIRGVLKGEPQLFERTYNRPDGTPGHLLGSYIPDIDERGDVCGFVVMATDVTSLKAAEAELKLAASVFESTIEGIVVTDADAIVVSVNRAFTEITGYSSEETVGQPISMIASKRHSPEYFTDMWHQITTGGHWQGEIWNRRKSGEVFLSRHTVTRIDNVPGEPVRYVGVFSDITELRRRDELTRHMAFHDALTDLPNRVLLMDRLDNRIALCEREQGRVAVMFLDLDGFKHVNDTLGHDVGDELLRALAGRLQAGVRRSDTVARLGGDEFVIVLFNPGTRDEVAQTAADIIARTNTPTDIAGRFASVGVSIGIAMYPEDGIDATELIARADTAMYAAKNAGRNAYRFASGEASLSST
jgi:diguanylate cyclase (GGDEF)-like protein/PAS domain S-box-containing protein